MCFINQSFNCRFMTARKTLRIESVLYIYLFFGKGTNQLINLSWSLSSSLCARNILNPMKLNQHWSLLAKFTSWSEKSLNKNIFTKFLLQNWRPRKPKKNIFFFARKQINKLMWKTWEIRRKKMRLSTFCRWFFFFSGYELDIFHNDNYFLTPFQLLSSDDLLQTKLMSTYLSHSFRQNHFEGKVNETFIFFSEINDNASKCLVYLHFTKANFSGSSFSFSFILVKGNWDADKWVSCWLCPPHALRALPTILIMNCLHWKNVWNFHYHRRSATQPESSNLITLIRQMLSLYTMPGSWNRASGGGGSASWLCLLFSFNLKVFFFFFCKFRFIFTNYLHSTFFTFSGSS